MTKDQAEQLASEIWHLLRANSTASTDEIGAILLRFYREQAAHMAALIVDDREGANYYADLSQLQSYVVGALVGNDKVLSREPDAK